MHKDVWNGWRISCQNKNLKHPTAMTSSLLHTQQRMLIYSLVFHGTIHCDAKMRGKKAQDVKCFWKSTHTPPPPPHTSPTSMLGAYVYMRKSQFFHFEIYYILHQFKFAPESSKYVSFSPTHFFYFCGTAM